ncbi:MAG: Cys-tRNA(Pro) deacylase [Actinobacteria bacterium]|nr:Cys-tRNA(Pro) deacylase [Actinomycetota bacterium]MSZ57971.1 Cys-tRNA(Pro) deacylase [Actinomycetota bacterium]
MHPYAHDPAERSFGDEAARALGLSPDEVFKTLVVMVDDAPTVAVLPVSARLDMKALAACCGGRRAELADLALAQRLTGYVIGGISPIGQKRQLPTLIDEQAWLHDVVYVSGGKRGLDIGLAPADLIRATSGTIAAIARAEPS